MNGGRWYPTATSLADGRVLVVSGSAAAHGTIEVNADSQITVDLNGACSTLTGVLGVDDEVGYQGTVAFTVTGDGTELYTSPIVTGASWAYSPADSTARCTALRPCSLANANRRSRSSFSTASFIDLPRSISLS